MSLILPEQQTLRRLFLNTNWAYLIDFRAHQQSLYRGRQQIPTTKFSDASEQAATVSKIMSVLLSALADFTREDLQAIEWSLSELTDNVIVHAESGVGGFVQVSNPTRSKRIEFAVCDCGIGVPQSLRQADASLSDQDALDQAIREGVTRDNSIGQGNGLYGTWRITELSKGRFEIYSGHASLLSNQHNGLHIRNESVPFDGTLVVGTILYENPIEISKALNFGGRGHSPIDFIEIEHEEDENGNVVVHVAKESEGFGSRAAGEPVRRKLLNLSRLAIGGKIIIDLAEIPMVSSSYAGEIFGKLLIEVGIVSFSQIYELRNVDPLVRGIIDKAVRQRAAQPRS